MVTWPKLSRRRSQLGKKILAGSAAGFAVVAVLLGVLLFTIAAQGDGPEQDHDHDTGIEHEPDIVRQQPDTHPDPDAAVIAEEQGITVAEAEEVLAWQDEWGEYAAQVRSQYGDQIAGIWAEPATGESISTKGYIQFVGAVPSGLEVPDSPANVTFLTDGGISRAQNRLRAELTADALAALGYVNFATGYSAKDKVINVRMQVAPGETPVTVDQISTKLEELLGTAGVTGRAATVNTTDLNLTVTTGTGPYIKTEHSRGGHWLLDNSTEICTSGWSVNGANGDGIVTAGHCEGLDQFQQPGASPYGMTHRSEVWGSQGDAEYHTTAHAERAEFYANSSTIRDVTGKKRTDDMEGETVCRYGRATNVMTCNHEVLEVGVVVHNANCNCFVRKLASATNADSDEGDSGGPYFRAYTAWGIHHGRGGGITYFTPIEQVEDALDVTLKTQ